MTRLKVNILGIEFDNFTQKELVHQLITDNQQHLNRFVVTANPEIVLAATRDPNYQQIINHADYVTADGIGIVKGAQILGTPLAERVTGFDTMQALLQYADQSQKKVYFLGGKPAVISALKNVIEKKYPHLVIAGMHDGYFNDEEPIVHEIQQAQPDFIFVALGFPKQDFFIAHHRSIANSIWMGVGGSFDVLTGNVQRAPEFWINHHIEWLFRLIQEPTRFKRMLALPRYLFRVYRQKFKQKK
ncbi:WecB/TagA/CpsF family glycosyltransferase [Ligilactobacillus aviarius]|uniref:WecB/TagA/CpsF family glycosyltransferase n=1 Tax=Ligilactobacillus aviarius TaxID=1606 RepID=UPI0024BA4FB5|nr:WecB/TagA/CpsF family glycosyltransferase [Ligilactobacillus aviarius]